MEYYQEPGNIGSMRGITPAVKALLIANIAIYFIEAVFGIPFSYYFKLSSVWYRHLAVGQLFTYMFIHAGFSHLLMNMLGLFFLGPITERRMGSYRFLVMYIVSGMLGGLGWSLLAPGHSYCVGASGAVMGVLGAFAAFYPNATLLLWLVVPIKAWVLVLILAFWELSQTIYDPMIGGIANAAHLGGGLAGYIFALTLKNPMLFRKLKSRRYGSASRRTVSSAGTVPREEIDRIFDKIGAEGIGALTPRERELLRKATRR